MAPKNTKELLLGGASVLLGVTDLELAFKAVTRSDQAILYGGALAAAVAGGVIFHMLNSGPGDGPDRQPPKDDNNSGDDGFGAGGGWI